METKRFASTKIRLPHFRAGLIARDSLEHELDDALMHRRLVLLSAPAGFGKTAALSRQLQQLPGDCAVAWVTVAEDDDIQNLLACLIEALEPFDPPWRTAPEALVERVGQDAGVREAAATLLAVLAATSVRRGVIALDDLHAISDTRVFDFLQLLIDGLPDNWTLAVATRIDPPLALARLRVQWELAEFRQDALSFSQEEVQRLWHTVTGEESPALAQDLFERTQGWAAGLCLSLDAGAGSTAVAMVHGGSRRRRHLFDFLASEVLGQMPDDLREFLLRCSVLPELTVSRCAQVSGNPSAAKLLEEIEQRGLFVSVLEGTELTLRLHDLFRDFLEERLRQLFPSELPVLLRRAAEGEHAPVRKVNLLLRAGACAEAAQALADMASRMLATSDSTPVLRLIAQFPPQEQTSSPQLAYARGLCAWQRFDDAALIREMRIAALGFDRLGQPEKAQQARAFEAIALVLLGRLEEALAVSRQVRTLPMGRDTAVLMELFDYSYTGVNGPPLGPAKHLHRLVDLMSADAPADLWDRVLPAVYLLMGRVGLSAPMQRFAQRALAAAGSENAPLQTGAKVLEAFLLLWQGHVAEAWLAIKGLNEDSRWLGHPRSVRTPLLRLNAVYHAIRGDRVAAYATCDALLEALPPQAISVPWRVVVATIQGRVAAAVDDWPKLAEALRTIDDHAAAILFSPVQTIVRTLSARHALHEARNEDALKILREAVRVSCNGDRMGLDASVRLHLAVAELRTGSAANAWQALAPLVEMVGTSGEVGGVLFAGVSVLSELAQAEWKSAAPPEGVAVLREWRDTALRWREAAPQQQPQPGLAPGNVAMPLSARELEVLALLADGQSNKLIARALGLSPHTIKRHVARILDRLDLSSRGQAAAWYRSLQPR